VGKILAGDDVKDELHILVQWLRSSGVRALAT